MKRQDQRSPGRNFFEMTRADFFTENSPTTHQWLREFREDLDLSLKKLGELLGVNYIQVWKWETGRVDPPKSELIGTLLLKILRETGDVDLNFATYPTLQQYQLLFLLEESKTLLKNKKQLIRSQTKKIYRKSASS